MYHHPIPLFPRRLLARCGGHARERVAQASGVVRSLTKLNNIISLVRERSLLQSLVYYIYVGKTSMSPWPLLRFSGISLLRYSVAGLHAGPHGKPLAKHIFTQEFKSKEKIRSCLIQTGSDFSLLLIWPVMHAACSAQDDDEERRGKDENKASDEDEEGWAGEDTQASQPASQPASTPASQPASQPVRLVW